MVFQRCSPNLFGLIFSIVIDEMITCDADDPGFQGSRFGTIQMQSPVNLQENLLRQIFSLVGSSCEAVGQIVDSRMAMSDNHFPGLAVAVPALVYQFGVGRFQRSDSASTTG